MAPQIRPVSAFLDANIVLDFYAYGKDDLRKLSEMKDGIVREKKFGLYLPTQVIDEIRRNREKLIAENIAEFNKRGTSKIPLAMQGLGKADEFNAAYRAAEKKRNELIAETRLLAEANELPADTLIEGLLKVSTKIPCDSTLITRAWSRQQIGNPPGKNGIRDELNWEALLHGCPDENDLHIVSRDGDFRSRLVEDQPHQFLRDEWRKKKSAGLFLHETISSFLTSVNLQIQLAFDSQRQRLVEQLASSGSYERTHRAISTLRPYLPHLTPSEADTLVSAAIANSQIGDIVGDNDVFEFYVDLINQHDLEDIGGDLKLLKAWLKRVEENRAASRF